MWFLSRTSRMLRTFRTWLSTTFKSSPEKSCSLFWIAASNQSIRIRLIVKRLAAVTSHVRNSIADVALDVDVDVVDFALGVDEDLQRRVVSDFSNHVAGEAHTGPAVGSGGGHGGAT
jgi:hypothetical protein